MIEDRRSSGEAQIKRNIEREVYMKSSILKGMLGAAIALAALAVRPAIARADDRNSNAIHIKAQFSDTEVLAVDAGTCDPVTFLPMAGDVSCIGTEKVAGTLSGDIEGSGIFEAAFVDFPDFSSRYVLYSAITGTVKDHGAGSFSLLDFNGVVQTDGSESDQWRVVDGTGSGQLADIAGNGHFVGMLNFSTGLGAGTFEGELEFHGQHQHH